MNNREMTQSKLKISFTILILVFTLESCNSDVSGTDNAAAESDTMEVESDSLTSEINILDEKNDFDSSKLTTGKLDSLKTEYQHKLDTGIDMLGTAREEYLNLCDLKNGYKEWLEFDCHENYVKDSTTINEWEASIKSVMAVQREALKKNYPDEDWGSDMEMIIYGAGSEQLYLFIEDLISSSKSWCN
jgi:hypothetical protein